MLTIANSLAHLPFLNKRVVTIAVIVIVAAVVVALLVAPSVVMAGPGGDLFDHCSC